MNHPTQNAAGYTFADWYQRAGFSDDDIAAGADERHSLRAVWQGGADPAEYKRALDDGRTVMPRLTPRPEFDALITRRRELVYELRCLQRRLDAARARGVAPITADMLTNDRVMALGLHASRMRVRSVADTVGTWLETRDDASTNAILAYLNTEATGEL